MTAGATGTAVDLDLTRFVLAEPVTVEDCQALYEHVKGELPGAVVDVCRRGNAVHVEARHAGRVYRRALLIERPGVGATASE